MGIYLNPGNENFNEILKGSSGITAGKKHPQAQYLC